MEDLKTKLEPVKVVAKTWMQMESFVEKIVTILQVFVMIAGIPRVMGVVK